MTDARSSADTRGAAITGDERDLNRNALFNILAFVLKLGNPALFVVVINSYGAERFGHFIAFQSIVQLASRLCLLGYDKALLWWLPRIRSDERFPVILAIATRIALSGGLVTLCLFALLPFLLERWLGAGTGSAAAAWMFMSILPVAGVEVTAHVALANRRAGVKVATKDVLVPTAQIGGAFACSFFPIKYVGLELALFIANCLALALAITLLRPELRSPNAVTGIRLGKSIPGNLWPYARNQWFAEMGAVLFTRMDVYVLSWFTSPATVGVYGAALQFAATIRSVRQALDPMVLAVLSSAHEKRDENRLRAAFSHATAQIMWIQAPMVAGISVFSEELMQLLGKDFSGGSVLVTILAGGWLLNGLFGFNLYIALAAGYSYVHLMAMGASIVFLFGVLCLLTPTWGVVGAAVSVAAAYLFQNAIHFSARQRVMRGLSWDRRVGYVLAVGLLASLALSALQLALPLKPTYLKDGISFAAFSVVFGVGWLLRRRWTVQRASPPERT